MPTEEREGYKVTCQGDWIRIAAVNGWEFVERNGSNAAVHVMCEFEDGTYLVTEQYRLPIDRREMAWPAGLVDPNESFGETGARELLEETGYRVTPADLFYLGKFCGSAGLTSEVSHLFYCQNPVKEFDTNGVDGENIISSRLNRHELLQRAHATGHSDAPGLSPLVTTGLVMADDLKKRLL